VFKGGFWTFFNNGNLGPCSGKPCQTNAMEILGSTKVWVYGLNTRSNTNMVGNSGGLTVTQNDNSGGWGGSVAAMLAMSN